MGDGTKKAKKSDATLPKIGFEKDADQSYMINVNPLARAKGRGAQSAAQSQRFDALQYESDGEWHDYIRTLGDDKQKLHTEVTLEHPKSIITRNTSPDVGFDRSINAYRGCEHGCIYCFARPTHAYHHLSPGLDFETKLFAKPDAADLLRRELARRSYRPAPIAMGTNTDPYQPIENRYRITRQVLEVCLDARHPVTILTKSDRILRDIGLLAEMAERKLVAVGISVTSLDATVSRLLEPRAASPAKRLAALQKLSAAGVPTHAMIAPVIPAITDEFLERIVEEVAARGVGVAGWIMLRLPHEVAPLFKEWLSVYYPDRAGKVMNIIRSARGGKDYDSAFFKRSRPDGVWGELFQTRFEKALHRYDATPPDFTLDCSQFRRPSPAGQLHLL